MNTVNQKQEVGNQLAYIQCQNAIKSLMLKLNFSIEKAREMDRRNAESFGVCPRYL